jgi:hypothetical protein
MSTTARRHGLGVGAQLPGDLDPLGRRNADRS